MPAPASEAPAAHRQQDGLLAGQGVYRRLLGYTLRRWTAFAGALLATAVFAATEPAFAALMKPMLDKGFVERDVDSMRIVPLLIVGLFLLRGIAAFASTYGMSWVGRGVIYDLRHDMFDKLLRLPAGFFDMHPSSQLVSKLIYNVEQVATAATGAITILVRDSLTALGLLGWMFYLSPRLAAVFLIFGPVAAVVVVYVSRRFRRISKRIQTSVGEVGQVAQEVAEGHRVVKIFGGQDYEREQFERVNRRNRRQQLKMTVTRATSVPVIQFLAACILAGVVYVAAVGTDIQTAGTFVSFITAMLLLLPALKRLTTVTEAIQRGLAAGESIFALLDHHEERDEGSRPLRRARGAIRFRGVTFSYRGDGSEGDRRPVLHGIDLDIPPGRTVALVGSSGGGKTTLVNLIPRFYEIDGGVVELDGHDVREYRLADLRRQIAWVGQQVTLFNDTIARNIAYGALQSASREQIVAAARAAHALDFIDQLPQGFDTMVGENGVLLSGGQRQRLAIARALLKDAPILILDEATSALDTESERAVQKGLERLMMGRTTVVIAHRLSTIERADRIVVLEQGRVVEEGSHGELIRRGGRYHALHRAQGHRQAPELEATDES